MVEWGAAVADDAGGRGEEAVADRADDVDGLLFAEDRSGQAPSSRAADSGRLAARFETLKREGRGGLVTFVSAGDPDYATSLRLVQGLPGAGADVIELGMPFTDPMADGPSIQASSLRALKAGMTLRGTLRLVEEFRLTDAETPIILMGYYNPIYAYGVERFLTDARAAGVDGLIVVDLPPEEDAELCLPAREAGINFIRLATPTTDDRRLPAVVKNTSGFVYYVSVTGITGGPAADATEVAPEVARIRAAAGLPVVVGFGISTPEAAQAVAGVADGCVVGSAIVKQIGEGRPVPEVLDFVADLARGAHGG